MLNLQSQIEAALAPDIKKHTVTVTPTREGIVVSLKEVGFFDSGSANVRPDAVPTLAHFVSVIRSIPIHIRIEGHTDNVPIHTARFDSNWELSTARATAMIKLFIAQFGIAPTASPLQATASITRSSPTTRRKAAPKTAVSMSCS